MEALIIQEFEPVVKQSGLEKAEQYAAIFAPFMITLKQLSDKAATVNKNEPTALDAKLAREIRLTLAKNRTATEKEKDKNKASLLAEGSLIQNLNNIVVNTSKLVEADLEAIEKFAENKEKERKALLATERAAMFTEYATDLTGYDLGAMADNVFSDLLESQKLLHEKRIADAARLQAEKIEAERLELERQKAVQAENERLKAEKDIADKALSFERAENERIAKIEADKQAKVLADTKAASEKLAKENADKLAAIEASNKAARDKAAAELKAAQDAATKAAKALQDKKDTEIKAAADKLAAEKKAAKAPDKEKLKVFVSSMQLPVIPDLSTDAANTTLAEIRSKFTSYINWALQQIDTL